MGGFGRSGVGFFFLEWVVRRFVVRIRDRVFWLFRILFGFIKIIDFFCWVLER